MKIAANNNLEFDCIFEKYEKLIYKICGIYLNTRQDIQDAFQEIMLRIYYKINSLRDKSKLKAWIVTITKNIALNLKRKVKKEILIGEDIHCIDKLVEHKDFIRINNSYILKLIYEDKEFNNKHKEAFLKFAIEGISFQELGLFYNTKINTIKSWIFRVRQYFMNKINNYSGKKNG